MSPQERIFYAAKAVGFDLTGYRYAEPAEQTEFMKNMNMNFFWGYEKLDYNETKTWNPLTDSAHAFYVMTMLEMKVDAGHNEEIVSAIAQYLGSVFITRFPIENCPMQAMRDAIVEVAAYIGRTMARLENESTS